MCKNQNSDVNDSIDVRRKAIINVSEMVTEEDSKLDGRLLIDTIAYPQDIQYPTDLNLLSDFGAKTED